MSSPLPILNNQHNPFIPRRVSTIKQIPLNKVYSKQFCSPQKDFVLSSQYQSQRLQTELNLYQTKPHKMKITIKRHPFKYKPSYDAISEKIKELDEKFKNVAKRAKRIIHIGNNNIKESQRFRKFSRNNNYFNNIYSKNISSIYDRITIYRTTEY